MIKQKKNSGQVLVLGIIMIVILLFAIFFFFDIHNVIRGKIKLETAEQASALSAARWQAESLNLIGELNLMIATERILLDDNIQVPEHMEDKEEVSDYTRGTARVTALNEMQSRITFIGPLIALAAAQQTAKNNGINLVRESGNIGRSLNVADDFAEYQNRLSEENNIYTASSNLIIHGYAWKEPYKKLLQEIRNNGIAVRPSGMIVGIEGVDPAYLADEGLYSAIIACSKGYPAWCQWNLRQLVKMDDAFFEGTDWYTPDFSYIRFSQQSEIYPLDLVLSSGITSLYEDFQQYAPQHNYEVMPVQSAGMFGCRFYHYNHRWSPDSATFNGPIVSEDSPWRRGLFLRRDVSKHAIYGGAMAYAECVENIPGVMSFRSAYTTAQAKDLHKGKSKLNRGTTNAIVKKNYDSSIRVGGNYSLDAQNSGCVAKPIGRLKNDAAPVEIPIVLPVFDRVNLIPSSLQNIRIFSYNWPVVEQFIIALKDILDSGKDIYAENLSLPEGSEYMLEALRLLADKHFRRSGYNPEFKSSNLTREDLIKLFDKDTNLYDPNDNPLGPGWLQQPMVYYGRNKYNLPDEALENEIYYYTADIANSLNASRGANTPAYVVPPASETWMFYNGKYIRMKGNDFFDNMEKDPYQGCGTIRSGSGGRYPPGTNSGPPRL